MRAHSGSSIGILLLVGILRFPAGLCAADPAPAAQADPNLPADYLERILTLVRQEHSQQVISDFIYSDPQKVKFVASPGAAKKVVTAVSVYFTPRSEGEPLSFNMLSRVMLFEKGMLLKDVAPADPDLDWPPDELPSTDLNLPADFREQLLELERQRNPTFGIARLEFSDPVRVLVRDPARPVPPVEMSAVVFSYSPTNRFTGEPYFMTVEGAALFNKGAFVRLIGFEDKTVEWINGKPSVRPDSHGQRLEAGARRLADAERLFGPVTGPAERRHIQSCRSGRAWASLKPVIAERPTAL